MSRAVIRERLERIVILSLVVACCLAAPLSTLAEDGGTPTAGQEVPSADPVVTEQPVEPPVEVIVTEPPPVTSEPLTPTAAIVATEPAPTQSADPTDPATEVPIFPDDLSCAPSGEATGVPGTAFAYDCTLQVGSDRSGTVLTLDLASAEDGWMVAVAGPITVELQAANPLVVTVPLAQVAGDTLTVTISIQSPADLDTALTSNATLTLDAARTPPDQAGPDATGVQTTMAVAVTAETTPAPEAGVMRIGTDPHLSCRTDTRRTPRPLGWDQGAIYQCTFSSLSGSPYGYSTLTLTLDQASYDGGWAVSAPSPSPPQKPETRRFDRGSGYMTCCTFFVAIWSPVEPSATTQATGTLTLSEDRGEARSVSVTFEVTVGESSIQTPSASFTCLNATHSPTNTFQPGVPLNLTCTLAALNGAISLATLRFTLPEGVRLSTYTDGSRGTLREWPPGQWEYTLLNDTVSPDTPLVLSLTFVSDRCDISASQLPLSFQLLVDDAILELNTTLATTATNPAAVSFALLSYYGGNLHFDSTQGSVIEFMPVMWVQPPGCLAAGDTQQISLSISGNGEHFQSTSTGQLSLNHVSLLSTYVTGGAGSVQAVQPSGTTPLTSSPTIAIVTAGGTGEAMLFADLALQVPAGTLPGTYWATITVDFTGGGN